MEEVLVNKKENVKNELVLPKKRIEYLDIARGIAIILMIIGHIVDFGWKRNAIFSFHMPLFVIISGMFYREKKIIPFVTNIIKKLILPYIIVILITNIIREFAIDNNGDIFSILKSYIKQILYSYSYLKVKTNIKPIGVLWFFPFLAIIRIIFYILKRICKEDDALLGVFCLCISYIGYILGIKGKWLLYSADVAFSGVILYYIGYIFYKHRILDRIFENKKLICAILLIWILGIKFGSIELAVRNYPGGLFSIATAVCGTIIILKISMVIEKKAKVLTKVLSWFGKNSMYILLIHHIECSLVFYDKIFKTIVNKKRIFKITVIFTKLGIVTIGTIIINYINKYIIQKIRRKLCQLHI